MSISLEDLQQEQAEWSERNFGAQQPWEDCMLGLVEEVGELSEGLGALNGIEWRPIEEADGLWEISELGQIRRLKPGKSTRVGNERKIQLGNHDGYCRVTLSQGTKDTERQFMVHRLVASAFLGPCPEGFEVNHIDGNKANNSVSNLEYLTPAENQRHAAAMGLWSPQCGENHGCAKLNEEQVAAIRARYAAGGVTHKKLASEYGVDRRLIGLIVARKVWVSIQAEPRLRYTRDEAALIAALGRLSHALLKQKQGIRGSSEEHEAAAKDAIGDITIYLVGLCTARGWSLAECVTNAWKEVGQRDWTTPGAE